MQEKDIRESIKMSLLQGKYFSYRPKDFIVYMVNSFWNVKFTYLEKTECELRIKRKGTSKDIVTKDFVSMDAVEACLRRLGVNEFKVIINI